MKKMMLSLFGLLVFASVAQADLTLYTDRPTARLQPAADAFHARTGQKVNIVEASYDQLMARLQAEGAGTPADLLFVKDLVYLGEVADKGMFQAMPSTRAAAQVASAMRHPQNHWVAVTYRARTLAYDPTRVDIRTISSYEDLADAKWAGRLCLRTSKGGYNEALTAQLIAKNGAQRTQTLLKGMIDNLAAPVFPNDTALLQAIAAGTCDIGIVNHYYLAQLHAQNPNFPVKIHFLDQNKGGTHVNGSGIGILKTSRQAALAQQFIDLLLSREFQLQISAGHFDYPAVMGLAPTSLIRNWGTFRASDANWQDVSRFVPTARNLFRQVGYP